MIEPAAPSDNSHSAESSGHLHRWKQHVGDKLNLDALPLADKRRQLQEKLQNATKLDALPLAEKRRQLQQKLQNATKIKTLSLEERRKQLEQKLQYAASSAGATIGATLGSAIGTKVDVHIKVIREAAAKTVKNVSAGKARLVPNLSKFAAGKTGTTISLAKFVPKCATIGMSVGAGAGSSLGLALLHRIFSVLGNGVTGLKRMRKDVEDDSEEEEVGNGNPFDRPLLRLLKEEPESIFAY